MVSEPKIPRRVTRSFVAIVAVTTLVLGVLAYDIDQNRHAIRQLRALANAQRQFRVERAKLTTQTFALICKAENGTREVERRRINRDFRNLDRNLRLLHIAKTPELVRIARADRNRNLADLKPLRCSKLPAAKGGAFPKAKGTP